MLRALTTTTAILLALPALAQEAAPDAAITSPAPSEEALAQALSAAEAGSAEVISADQPSTVPATPADPAIPAEPAPVAEPEPFLDPAPGPASDPEPIITPDPLPEPDPLPVPEPLPEPEPLPAPEPVISPQPVTPEPVPTPEPLPSDAIVNPLPSGTDADPSAPLPTDDPAPEPVPAPADPSAVPVPAPQVPGTTVIPAPEPAPAAALSEDEAAEVTERVISNAEARASDEDFGNSVSERMSDDARAALFGLGGFALGHVLSDRSTVTLNTGDRVVVTDEQGVARVIKNDDAMLVAPGHELRTEAFADGSTRSVITRPDGSQIITVRDAQMRVLNRRLITADGLDVVLVDQTVVVDPVDLSRLPPPVVATPVVATDEDSLRRALLTVAPVNRSFSLEQVLTIREVRDLAAPIGVPDITFATGSAAISADQARSLLALGNVIRSMIETDPREVFLIEGHTDAVGSDVSNLALSDRRAESVAKALVEHFGVPAENLLVQGYGERYLLVPSEGDVRENRRAAVRRITPLLAGG